MSINQYLVPDSSRYLKSDCQSADSRISAPEHSHRKPCLGLRFVNNKRKFLTNENHPVLLFGA